MELQWPLIIFTTLVAWSAGLFATQCIFAIRGEGKKAQLPAWLCAGALLIAACIAVFFHLEHWDRIFNGFSHLSSGITQELIFIVLLAIAAIVFLIMLKKGKDLKVISIVGIVISALLLVFMAHSYVMASKPAWDTILWILYIFGNACAFGPFSWAVLMDAEEAKDSKLLGILAIAGGAINAVAAVAYAFFVNASVNSFYGADFYFDAVHPTANMIDVAGGIASQGVLIWLGAVAIGAILPLLLAFVAKKGGKWKLLGAASVVLVLIGAVCMRIAFYGVGFSIYTIF